MNPKIRRDPYLAPLCARHGDQAAFEAGFFEDDDPLDAPLDDVDWLCTPTDPVRRALAGGRSGGAGDRGSRPVVLVSTGGFFPVHSGHLAMMASARRAAEASGWWVVGGYLSPGHDRYLALKCGGLPMAASDRLALAAAAIADHDWLAVDPWEALARRVAVNFTDVTARLERYLRAQVDPRIDVAFVCGADNARFALAFAATGRAIVVGRPGHEATADRWRHDPRLAAGDRVLWAPGDDASASSDLRPVAPGRPAPVRLRLRREDARAVATLGLDGHRWQDFQAALVALLAEDLDVQTSPLPAAGGGGGDHRPPTVSLDPFVPGDVDLAVSRHFDLGGYRLLGHGARPDSRPVREQLRALTPGRWRLVDDDRATGSTFDHVRRHLPAGVVLEEAAFAVDGVDADTEIGDSRDFLLGTDHGGLVVVLPDGTLGRAPYVLPYVDPAVRCAVPAARALAFSRDVWHLNERTFAGTGLRVGHLPPAAARTLRRAGHGPGDPLADVCARHAATLDHLLALGDDPPPAGART